MNGVCNYEDDSSVISDDSADSFDVREAENADVFISTSDEENSTNGSFNYSGSCLKLNCFNEIVINPSISHREQLVYGLCFFIFKS